MIAVQEFHCSPTEDDIHLAFGTATLLPAPDKSDDSVRSTYNGAVSTFGRRILIADDDRELAGLMRDFLEINGFTTGAASNGPDAVQAALSDNYDLVVLDVMMPGFDGFEVLRRVRRESRIAVLMLTARTESGSRIRGLDSGADDYLPKPFEPAELLARIRAVLRRTRPTTDRAPLQVSGIRVEPSTRRVFRDGLQVDVTSVEYDIL